ncbi:L-aminoadipate-semialdehyde dehydrogenase large subunit [Sodiomyces alkalinus F11]|uniref:Alpha-aminoadipate reductase n=1 Tax=Sodiomyces alkalinus (strain CBS 110278 / VKM F-3762 / F11) TaxID=1314773 RepID=A0A3N2PQD2_SODAK|nr:L-aminoadipate-semialdehyde dehydrogenase large subunit [Sodiomyces alkalinus F11]ROT36717.1 L-aminoadipate-semialdehyde dehydrogenase large subunit [Sodiomyces alkalinus F11]
MAAVIPDPTADLHWGEFRGAIHDIFAANAQAHPDRPCVVETKGYRAPERVFNYQQINEASNHLAHYFIAHGCERGDVVMIYAYRGVELVVAYMGALKAGATVSVLDPQYPPDRQKILLEVAGPRFLVHILRATEESGKMSDSVAEFIKSNLSIKAEVPALQLLADGRLQGGLVHVDGQDCLHDYESLRGSLPGVVVGPDSIPTLSFTSGSEGRPKGVQGRHFSLTYYTPWMADTFGLSERDRFTMLSGIAHDPIQRDIFTPLFLGAQIIVPPRDSIAHEILAEWMKENRITVTHLTPAMGQILVGGATTQFPTLHHAFFVGDLLTKKDCRRLQELAPNAYIVNMYGTTETQRSVSYFEVPSKLAQPNALDDLPDVIPVGQGMLNVQLLVVDRDNRNRVCDVGEQGELFLRAAGLAEGYLGNDDVSRKLNESKFLTNWFVDPAQWAEQEKEKEKENAASASEPWRQFYKGPRDRVYRTGDLGRFRPDGTVECTGRIDNQVKVRGFRIELGEIDAHLSRHPFIRENITMTRRDKDEEPILVSYIVPEAKRWFQHLSGGDGDASLVPDTSDESMAAMLRRFKSLSEDCKNFLKTKVPHYAIPTMFIPLMRMPLNPNGKIDKPALPFPSETDLATLHRRASRSSSALASLTETQKKLAGLWAEILPNRTARMFVPKSNFFEEGGHSILAQRMLFRVRQTWKEIDIPMSAIFQSQTLEAFAAEIDRAQDPTGLRLDAGIATGYDPVAQDEAYAADADDLMSQLPEFIPGVPADAPAPQTVFLTGATGFLGSYIVRELLDRNLRVIAHVRSRDASSGLARIEAATKAYGLWSDDWRSRLQAVSGDIAKPRLGLSSSDWELVANEADVIIHNGAQVNWMLPYSSLRNANVISTMDCIGLCTQGKPKRLAFVSSTSTLDSDHYVKLSQESVAAGGKGVPESDDLSGSRKGLGTGYGQSKWASEAVVREAGRRGLVGAVVRPGYIMGDPTSGISVTDDYLVRLWKGCLQVQARPDIANTLNQVPVTQVSRIVVASALHPPTDRDRDSDPLGVVQVTSHPRLTLNDWVGALETYGYPVPRVPYEDWSSKLRAYVADETKEELALLPLFHHVTGNLPTDSIAPELDDVNAAAVLGAYEGDAAPADRDPLSDNVVDIDAIGMYLAYLVAIGFLPAPAAGQRALPSCGLTPERVEAMANLGGRGK